MMDSKKIRESFLDYFEENGHTVLESSPLVPSDDPTLFFTNAGMVQFKKVFTGVEKLPFRRATSSQKCLRVSGKHNDLENVGRTARHHTFFEMLGNFSFGDYFKEDAIRFAVEFLTESMKLDRDTFYITVFRDDDDSFRIWKDREGFPEERIFRMGEKDNFWAMGETGPCGPCSEVVVDQGEGTGCQRPGCGIDCGCDRFLEVWNLVFMQFFRDRDGSMTPLPEPSIDTGMGLERITALVQGKKSNYETDLFAPFIRMVEEISHRRYGRDDETDISMRVVADHSRAAAFLIAEGVFPSNEERGYVLRRIMRRAMRHGLKLGIDAPFFHRIGEKVVEVMGGIYPELKRSGNLIPEVIEREERRFSETLKDGMAILDEEVRRLKKGGEKVIPGEVVFRLYDTFGFPHDLTGSIASEHGMEIDEGGFERMMEIQRERAREAASTSKGMDREIYRDLVKRGAETIFTGYDEIEGKVRVFSILKDGREVDGAVAGDEVDILVDRTPFYGESGGQAGDRGVIEGDGLLIHVRTTLREGPLTIHRGRVEKGEIGKGTTALMKVDREERLSTMRNHTATHLLHYALRKVLGPHVKQRGSLVEPSRLRFDFSHFEPMKEDEIREVELIVNRKVMENLGVEKFFTSKKDALKMGAIALFGEKYGEEVRVVKIGDFSIELCGGTHLERTGDIGLFRIRSEGGVAAGIRRIEALTGEGALDWLFEREGILLSAARALKVEPHTLAGRVETLIREKKEMERTVESLKSKLMRGEVIDFDPSRIREIGGVRVIVKEVAGFSRKEMRDLVDRFKERLSSGVILLASKGEGSLSLACGVTDDLTGRFHAGKILKELAKAVGGGGGGRADFAEAGGKRPECLEDAIRIFENMITSAA